MSLLVSIAYIIMIVLSLVGIWKVYEKAGQPGWHSIIPFLNLFTWLKIVKKPYWWFFLMLIPLVNLVIAFMLGIELAKAFGKGTLFGVGLVLLPIVFYPILGFGEDTYQYAKTPIWGEDEALDAEIVD
ncbi:MAG: hypothetical protein SchgKO_02660 [Schleiferiaceae bacterium]